MGKFLPREGTENNNYSQVFERGDMGSTSDERVERRHFSPSARALACSKPSLFRVFPSIRLYARPVVGMHMPI